MVTMMVTIDRAGRVVIPKDVRDRLSLGSQTELELSIEGDSIRLTPVRGTGRLFRMVDGFPRIDAIAGITTTDTDVQGWRDADQR